jgi:AraC family transcriptional regulator
MSGDKFDYYIAVATDQPVPEGMTEYQIPGGTWPIFLVPIIQIIEKLLEDFA